MPLQYLIVFLFGGLGAVSRYITVSAANRWWAGAILPLGTLLVNVLGALAIGFALGAIGWHMGEQPAARWKGWHGAVTGFLGGYTTFSAFSLENFILLHEGKVGLAVLYAGLSVLTCLGATALGFVLGQMSANTFKK